MPTTFLDEQILLQARIEALAESIAEEVVGPLEDALESVEAKVLFYAVKAEDTPSLLRKKGYLNKQMKEMDDTHGEAYAALILLTGRRATKVAKDLPAVIHQIHTTKVPKVADNLKLPVIK